MANYSQRPGSNTGSNSRSTYDAFSMLATPPSSKPSSRTLTPNPSRPQQSHPTGSTGQGGHDAFSSLLGASFTAQSSQENLSLAARQAAARKEQQAKVTKAAESGQVESTVWSGLDALGQGSLKSSSKNSGAQVSSTNADDDWLFDNVAKSTTTSTSRPANPPISTHVDDDWGLSEFTDKSKTHEPAQSNAGTQGSLFDAFEDGDLLSDSFSQSRPQHAPSSHTEEVDDILGVLGKPVASNSTSPPEPATPVAVTERETRARADSPPPHLIGQIVEMGFSPEQARLALASTDTGLDVQQALDTLLSNGVGSDFSDEPPPERPRRGLADYREEDDRWEEHGEEDSPPRRRVARQTASSSVPPSRAQKQANLASGDIQAQADKLLAQASEIGLNMFNRANALWKDGKEKVQKAYEERAAGTKSRPVNDGRPRWMSDAPPDEDERVQRRGASSKGASHGGFGDSDDDDVQEQTPESKAPRTSARSDRIAADRAPQAANPRVANLFDAEPSAYISPSRRRPVVSRSSSQAETSTAPTPSSSNQKSRASTPLRTRQTVTASASAIASSNAHKAKGTELYKLGQFANAEQAYSAALDTLPANHLLLVPLYNNRAQSRLKIGEYSGAVDDCTAVLSIIGLDYHPAREAKVTREDEGTSVDLADALLKALRRRAEAYEGREKWEQALKDWEAITACDWSAKMRTDAFAGASRCRKMLSPEKEPPVASKFPAPRPAARPAVSVAEQDFKAVENLRQANRAQEEEDALKASLKDSVDARLNVWKAGKETNVRALVASLETVLWPELGWQKVGLHELVSPGQVKVRYMKAIAKLHPDKINSGNTTVEQRMIANGVFAALNDAWLAFKQ
ncbi:uncharacterized protein FOMMEDRAFT_169260 [Fomitiporia mediterranea MF3/22]|uniref:uncharacterized protein n=1 Tax=Fomitiporia mediterranea (strain MF3/22) TaxID=694068 RepID=UPI0004408A72|nr:uncharacterized protein FOMMEDRAFT_169260 [Fomitiporia mediterranea MF3/22]EJD01067.1 hypothetical protein FOMMEDRAFT_169260 [Fomitiporia mediterranea MF3/22]